MIGVEQIVARHEVSEAEAEPERQRHPHHRGDERRAPEIAQEPQIGLEARQQQEQAHADSAEGVEQVHLLRVRGEEGRERRRRIVAEQAGPEDDPPRHLAHHRRQADPLGDLGAETGHGDQQRQLDEQQEDRVTRQARRVHASRP